MDSGSVLRAAARRRAVGIWIGGVAIVLLGALHLVLSVVLAPPAPIRLVPALWMAGGGFILVIAWRYSRQLRRRPAARVTFSSSGVSYSDGAEQAHFPWSDVAGVGISYDKLRGTHMLRPQVELFVATPLPADRWPGLAWHLRTEPPPSPHLPESRYRFLVPAGGPISLLGQVVHDLSPSAWLGWFRRGGTDVPWPLR